MKINRHNYEAFLLDQLEGTLSVEDQRELEQFFLLNPDCAPELEEMEPVVLKSENLLFRHTEKLKKEFPDHSSVLDESNFDTFSIARMEGDLQEQQIKDHQAMLEADHQKAESWMQWQQTRLVAETHVYPYKEQLKHNGPVRSRVLWISVVSAAAALALLMVLFRSGADQPQPEVITQAPKEEIFDQGADVVLQAAEPVMPDDPVGSQVAVHINDPNIKRQEVPGQEPLNMEDSKLFQEDHPMGETAAQVDILPRFHSISSHLFPGESAISETEPDRIQALQIAPVPVHLRSLTLAQISDIGLQEVLEDYAEENNLSLWKIANAGIKGINKLAGSDISLLAARDEQGDISGYELKSKRFSLSRPLSGEE